MSPAGSVQALLGHSENTGGLHLAQDLLPLSAIEAFKRGALARPGRPPGAEDERRPMVAAPHRRHMGSSHTSSAGQGGGGGQRRDVRASLGLFRRDVEPTVTCTAARRPVGLATVFQASTGRT